MTTTYTLPDEIVNLAIEASTTAYSKGADSTDIGIFVVQAVAPRIAADTLQRLGASIDPDRGMIMDDNMLSSYGEGYIEALRVVMLAITQLINAQHSDDTGED